MATPTARQQAGAKWAARRAEEARAMEDGLGSPDNMQRRPSRKKTNPSPNAFSAYGGMMPNAAMNYMGGMPGFYPPPMSPYQFGMDPMAMRGSFSGMYPPMPPMMPMGPMPYGGMHGGVPGPRGGGKGGRGKGGKGADGKGGGRAQKPRMQVKPDEDKTPKTDDEELDPNMCPLLRAFRTGEQSELGLAEIMPNILEFAKDPKGSAELSRLLEEAGRADKQAAVTALTPEVRSLSLDANGSSVIQKLFELCNGEQRRALTAELKGDFLKKTMDSNGCRVVQKAIEHMSKEAQLIVANELKEHVLDCIHSMHGNHVVQKCVEQMPPDTVQFIVEAVENETDALVVHRYGCRIVQRLLEHCAPHQLEKMMDKICDGTSKFAKDPYGNYVVQHMLQHGRKEDKKRIIAIIKGQILDFAQHKCSSNVVDKCFEVATIGEHAVALDEERAALTAAVLGEEGDPNPPIKSMMHDRFGSHIIQHMLEHSRGPEREELITRLKKEESRLRTSAAGRRLVNSLSAA